MTKEKILDKIGQELAHGGITMEQYLMLYRMSYDKDPVILLETLLLVFTEIGSCKKETKPIDIAVVKDNNEKYKTPYLSKFIDGETFTYKGKTITYFEINTQKDFVIRPGESYTFAQLKRIFIPSVLAKMISNGVFSYNVNQNL